jgi:8-oxo-dGTP pyrophosphatase MutT (NUDIX family)
MYFTDKERAGLLPCYIDKAGEIWFCLMIPSDPEYGGVSPQISKGHIDEGEISEDAAIREAKEELGYIHSSKYKINPVYKANGIDWFYVLVDNKKLGKHHYETGKVLWLNSSEVFKQIRHWQKPILASVYHAVKKAMKNPTM